MHLHTCGQDQLVLFHGQATEAGVSGARVLAQGREKGTLVLWDRAYQALGTGGWKPGGERSGAIWGPVILPARAVENSGRPRHFY